MNNIIITDATFPFNNIPLTPIQQQLFTLLKTKGPMTRSEICDALGYDKIIYDYVQYPQKYPSDWRSSHKGYQRTRIQHRNRTTIYDNLLKLQKKKLVEKYSIHNGKRGRSKTYWKILN